MAETLLVFGTGLAGTGTAIGALLLLYHRPPRPLWPVLPIVFAAASAWCFLEIATSAVVREPRAYWITLAAFYTAVEIFVVSWWIMSLRYLRWVGRPLTGDRTYLTWIPIVLVSLLWLLMVTNPWHERFVVPVAGGRNEYRLFYFVYLFALYSLLWGSWGIYGYVRLVSHEHRITRPLNWVLCATIIPLVANGAYQLQIWPYNFDPTAMSVGISGAIFAYAVYHDQLLVLLPVSFSKVFDFSPHAVFILDPDGCIVSWNHAGNAFVYADSRVRYPNAYMTLSPPLRTLGRASGPVSPAEFEEAVKSEGADEIGVLYRLDASLVRNGWRTVRVYLNEIPGRRSSVAGYVLRIADETVLQETREREREQNAVLTGILAATGDAVLVTDTIGHVIFANSAFGSAWDMDESEVLELDRDAFIEVLCRPMMDSGRFRQSFETGIDDPMSEFTGEITFENGRTWIWATRPYVRAAEAFGRIWMFTDVTATRAFEEERRRMDQMMQRRQRLESLGVLAGGIAHDFNNLLMVIMGNIDLARHDLQDPESLELSLNLAYDSSQRAAELTDQMLAYSGQGAFQSEQINLSELVIETISLLGSQLSNNARVVKDITPELWGQGDSTQLRQVIMNLMTNASEALQGSPGTITVTVAPIVKTEPFHAQPAMGYTLPEGTYHLVTIEDTGVGMAPDTVARAFEPFFTTKFTGRGLGLAAVLGIVGTHGGSLEVHSEEGRGTRVDLILPRVQSDTEEDGTAETAPYAGSVHGDGRGRILLIEDEPPIMNLVRQYLDSAGYDVYWVVNGLEGTELLKRSAPEIDLVLLDMTMPEMNGAEFHEMLRANYPEIPVIVMSGYTEHYVQGRVDGAANVQFLKKPFSKSELLDAMEATIGQSD